MMFSIDLLKGKGLPVRTDFKRLALKVVSFVIPLCAVSVMAVNYHGGRAELASLRAGIDTHQQQILQYRDDAASYQAVHQQIKQMETCKSDLSGVLGYRMTVSDMLLDLTGLLGDDIFMNEIKLERTAVQERPKGQDSGPDAKPRLYVRRTLRLTLCSYGTAGSDESVQAYVNRIKQSPALSDLFTDVALSARQQGPADGKPSTFYEIECVLKQQG